MTKNAAITTLIDILNHFKDMVGTGWAVRLEITEDDVEALQMGIAALVDSAKREDDLK